MSTPRIYRPDPRYGILLAIGVLLVFLGCVAPFAFIALAPDIGPRLSALVPDRQRAVDRRRVHPDRPYVRSIEYELGERELIVRRGLLTKSTDLVPYHMITNVALRRGLFARALGLGKLKIHTAGYSQSTDAEATVAGVANYEELRAAIIARMRAASQTAQPHHSDSRRRRRTRAAAGAVG